MIGTIVSVAAAYQRVRHDSFTRTAVAAYRKYAVDLKLLDFESKKKILVDREAYEFKILMETDMPAAFEQVGYDVNFNQIIRREFDPRRK